MGKKNIKYMIMSEEKCQACDGNGWIIHPAWQEYYKQSSVRKISHEEFFAGWWKIPPEEIKCDECDGEGTKKNKIELTKEILLTILNS